jgi:hypothetical protein
MPVGAVALFAADVPKATARQDGAAGRYQVAVTATGALLLDTASGRAWRMISEGEAVRWTAMPLPGAGQ